MASVPFRSTYLMLKNGLVIRDSEGHEGAEILCDIDERKDSVNSPVRFVRTLRLISKKAFDSCARREIASRHRARRCTAGKMRA
jgi:hypothetical protein